MFAIISKRSNIRQSNFQQAYNKESATQMHKMFTKTWWVGGGKPKKIIHQTLLSKGKNLISYYLFFHTWCDQTTKQLMLNCEHVLSGNDRPEY